MRAHSSHRRVCTACATGALAHLFRERSPRINAQWLATASFLCEPRSYWRSVGRFAYVVLVPQLCNLLLYVFIAYIASGSFELFTLEASLRANMRETCLDAAQLTCALDEHGGGGGGAGGSGGGGAANVTARLAAYAGPASRTPTCARFGSHSACTRHCSRAFFSPRRVHCVGYRCVLFALYLSVSTESVLFPWAHTMHALAIAAVHTRGSLRRVCTACAAGALPVGALGFAAHAAPVALGAARDARRGAAAARAAPPRDHARAWRRRARPLGGRHHLARARAAVGDQAHTGPCTCTRHRCTLLTVVCCTVWAAGRSTPPSAASRATRCRRTAARCSWWSTWMRTARRRTGWPHASARAARACTTSRGASRAATPS